MRKFLIGILLIVILAIFALIVISGVQMRKPKRRVFYKVNS